MKTTAVLLAVVGIAAAFQPGVRMPIKMPARAARATDAEMMPKFLKDLFPGMRDQARKIDSLLCTELETELLTRWRPSLTMRIVCYCLADMEKPDDPLGAIKSFFGIKDEEPAAPETPAPEDVPAAADEESKEEASE